MYVYAHICKVIKHVNPITSHPFVARNGRRPFLASVVEGF